LKFIDIQAADQLLKQGEVVAIPTETVYGLAGWIHSEAGLRRIFSVKERPFFDPLIVHVAGIEEAKLLTTDWTDLHQALAEACWPGPLTLIAKKHPDLNPLITAGLDSVGLRCPDHPLTLALLKRTQGGLAAPSANKFGKTSPTRPEHVQDEFQGEVAILDGGECQVGIESTVVGILTEAGEQVIEIYRPGKFTAAHFQKILEARFPAIKIRYAESPVAPGQLKHHYMPKIPLVIVSQDFNWERDRGQVESVLGKKFAHPVMWDQSPDPLIASRELYHQLRSFDQVGHDVIIVTRRPGQESEDWQGIWNRLEKAKSLKL
jgi:L-threonylcarbamoyladenylate synthase